ncbi:putative Arf GTPase activating protein [Ordospora colligata]|uniref:Putative Arf GTPase activating protein n=1 Tax=Ordospora colligata OC4 TaxID=1354746 RepID=A0A0B2UIF6_9MICR|nr:putative Arf GTPase activating protein [Ordospora colligata OC4]KHN68822.1 putative Arf GTPase activating protein [Ordospora colligata OC4]TBU13856.1 putative Arf GTPase activating protein [Ordospora colligata]TBU14045.1 putative Arf GTPase activating protein [Ordospora colligata]TBU17714.1 putative Arf GTPase activating protein [Ordospora colligata]
MSKNFNKEVKELCLQERNNRCVDCSAPSPPWASVTHGVFICFDCASIHRSLGVEMSFVKSVNLDGWDKREYLCMKKGTNERFKAYIEKHNLVGKEARDVYGSNAVKKYANEIKEAVAQEMGPSVIHEPNSGKIKSNDENKESMTSRKASEPIYKVRAGEDECAANSSTSSLQESITSSLSTMGSVIFSGAKAIKNKTVEHGSLVMMSMKNIIKDNSSSLASMFKTTESTQKIMPKEPKKQNTYEQISKWD